MFEEYLSEFFKVLKLLVFEVLKHLDEKATQIKIF